MAFAPCPTGVTLAAAQQSAGSSTVVVTVTPSVLIKPAADADPNSFHLHYYVDKPIGTLKPGDEMPAGDTQIVHSGATTLNLNLTPGPHAVVVVLGQLAHQACGDAAGNVVMGTATFTVAAQTTPTATVAAPTPAATTAAAAPKTVNAGLAAEASSPLATVLLAVTAALVLGGAVLARRCG
ncbi:MAG: DUF4399 domain-containing protein [Dehalococcoidia bacterium]|nr:DUF4399 domain-containing protein [Dehalococcoidia bacterium]